MKAYDRWWRSPFVGGKRGRYNESTGFGESQRRQQMRLFCCKPEWKHARGGGARLRRAGNAVDITNPHWLVRTVATAHSFLFRCLRGFVLHFCHFVSFRYESGLRQREMSARRRVFFFVPPRNTVYEFLLVVRGRTREPDAKSGSR